MKKNLLAVIMIALFCLLVGEPTDGELTMKFFAVKAFAVGGLILIGYLFKDCEGIEDCEDDM